MERKFYDLRDGRISAVHFGDASTPPQILLAHANGFNGLSYRAVLEPLGVHAIALDLRGHGMSELPTKPESLRNWYIIRDDIVEFVERYIPGNIILAGHSLGGVCTILATPYLKNRVTGYAGFDPVTVAWPVRWFSQMPGGRALMKRHFPLARNAGRRRFVFDNLEAALERYRGRGAFKEMREEILRDYLEGGLTGHPDGAQLACHPLWEQAIFTAQGQNMFEALPALPANSHILYGGKSAVSSPRTRAAVARKLTGGRMSFDKNLHHLFPFRKPAIAQEMLQGVLDGAR